MCVKQKPKYHCNTPNFIASLAFTKCKKNTDIIIVSFEIIIVDYILSVFFFFFYNFERQRSIHV